MPNERGREPAAPVRAGRLGDNDTMEHAPIAPNSPLGKAILARIRSGDYAHAGEEEAIALTLSDVAPDPARSVLDVGCGRGGSAEWVRRHGLGRVTGIDIDAESIAHARDAYPECAFVVGDVVDVATVVEPGVELAYALNAFYAFPDLAAALRAVRAVAANGAELRIFDYVREGGEDPPANAIVPGRALERHALRSALGETGWQVVAERDLGPEYVRWYESLVGRMTDRRPDLEREFGRRTVGGLAAFYEALLELLRSGEIGGALVSARAA